MLKISDLNNAGHRFNMVPDESMLETIPPANRADFELKPSEVKSARRYIYAVNKVNKMRFMTRLDGGILMVWRIK
jgi:hypothetical protein